MKDRSSTLITTATKTDSANQVSTIESPCIGVCKLDSTSDYCIGCFRSRKDLTVWSKANNTQKQKILDTALLRQKSFNQTSNT